MSIPGVPMTLKKLLPVDSERFIQSQMQLCLNKMQLCLNMYHASEMDRSRASAGWMEAHLTRAMLGGAPMEVTCSSRSSRVHALFSHWDTIIFLLLSHYVHTDILTNRYTMSPPKFDDIPLWPSHYHHNACADN